MVSDSLDKEPMENWQGFIAAHWTQVCMSRNLGLRRSLERCLLGSAVILFQRFLESLGSPCMPASPGVHLLPDTLWLRLLHCWSELKCTSPPGQACATSNGVNAAWPWWAPELKDMVTSALPLLSTSSWKMNILASSQVWAALWMACQLWYHPSLGKFSTLEEHRDRRINCDTARARACFVGNTNCSGEEKNWIYFIFMLNELIAQTVSSHTRAVSGINIRAGFNM